MSHLKRISAGASFLFMPQQFLGNCVHQSYTVIILVAHAASSPDPYYERAQNVYRGLNEFDAEAVWSFQGWQFINPNNIADQEHLHSFVNAVPQGKFNIIDMPTIPCEGEFRYSNAAFWSARYILTSLHNFGGNDGMRGNISQLNCLPFIGYEANETGRFAPWQSNIWGTGSTDEGIDQNPVYSQFLSAMAFEATPVADIAFTVSERSQKKYFGPHASKKSTAAARSLVDKAWRLLVENVYTYDSVHDQSNIVHFGTGAQYGVQDWSWGGPSQVNTANPMETPPTPALCSAYAAWGSMIQAAELNQGILAQNEPFRYDLVNVGREILAQISGPVGYSLIQLLMGNTPAADQVQQRGDAWVNLLQDADELTNTDSSFQLGPWLQMAKNLAKEYETEDCALPAPYKQDWPTITNCSRFYEWNARTQITSWLPTKKGAPSIQTSAGGAVMDYANRQWAGLIQDYYAERVRRQTALNVQAVKAGTWPPSQAIEDELIANLTYEFTTSTKLYPLNPVGDLIEVSKKLHMKYGPWFRICSPSNYKSNSSATRNSAARPSFQSTPPGMGEQIAALKIKNKGSVEAVEALVLRLFPSFESFSSSPFIFVLFDNVESTCALSIEPPCFMIQDVDPSHDAADARKRIKITATTASELTAGLGYYLTTVCNMTFGLARAGGDNLFIPADAVWPSVGAGMQIARRRNTPWSYWMNVVTLSYSLVWYSWKDWEHFIDWMALSGINLFPALAGQEEVQYSVLRSYGLGDMDIRTWFNGPALLSWSRGQNEYGANILGPLPRSFMKNQFTLNQRILNRTRSLGISAQLPGFQGNVPAPLKRILNDSSMTIQDKYTAWIDALDPVYINITRRWMTRIVESFGSDHWWQVDGWFDGNTGPWVRGF